MPVAHSTHADLDTLSEFHAAEVQVITLGAPQPACFLSRQLGPGEVMKAGSGPPGRHPVAGVGVLREAGAAARPRRPAVRLHRPSTRARRGDAGSSSA